MKLPAIRPVNRQHLLLLTATCSALVVAAGCTSGEDTNEYASSDAAGYDSNASDTSIDSSLTDSSSVQDASDSGNDTAEDSSGDSSLDVKDSSANDASDSSTPDAIDSSANDASDSSTPDAKDSSLTDASDSSTPDASTWPSSFALWGSNPILVPTGGYANHGADNVYAPEIVEVSGVRVMFYGAQGADGHDRIYLAWAQKNGMEWRKYPKDSTPEPVLDRGSSNHVNDPSVVQVGATFKMYYTDAPTAELDRIWLAEATNLSKFTKTGEVFGPVPGTWENDKVGRPAVIVENGVYKMWYDGTANGQRHVGFASSTDGLHFTRYAKNPIVLNAGAIDVKKVGGTYVMLREGGDGTYWSTSSDGLSWVDRGKLFGLSGKAYDAYGQVTPFLETDGNSVKAIWFGGASVNTWNKNRIAAAFPSGALVPSGGGCTACTTEGITCAESCKTGGSCGAPGSTNPGACCACAPEGCGGCMQSVDCQAACVAGGKAGGWCAQPGSTTPSACCACLP